MQTRDTYIAKITTPHARHQSGNVSAGSSSLRGHPLSSLFSSPVSSLSSPLSSILSSLLSPSLSSLLSPLFSPLSAPKASPKVTTVLRFATRTPTIPVTVDTFETRKRDAGPKEFCVSQRPPPTPVTVGTFGRLSAKSDECDDSSAFRDDFPCQKCGHSRALAKACERFANACGRLRTLCERLRTQTQRLLVTSWNPGPQP